jgi:hypothetical protein
VLDVLGELLTGEQAKAGVVVDASGDGLLVIAREDGLELRLAAEDEAEDEAAVHLEVGEEADEGEGVAAEVLRLVEEDDRAAAFAVDSVLEALLEGAHEEGVGAGWSRAAGRGYFAAEVSFGEVGDFDVADIVTGLGESGGEAAQEGRLAGAGRGDEGATVASLDAALEALEGVGEEGEVEVLLGADFSGEGGGVEAEGAAEVSHGLPFVGGLQVGRKPPSGPTTEPWARAKAREAAVLGVPSSSSGAGAVGAARLAMALAARSTG